MKKIALVALCLAVLVAAGSAAQAPIVLKVKVPTANVRAEADTAGAVLKQVSLGTLLEARQKIGDWYEITITNEMGARITAYISASVVDIVSAGQTLPPVREEAPVQAPVRAAPRAEAPAADYASPRPSTGGFKLIGGFGSANMSFTNSSTTDTSQIDQYKKGRTGFTGGIGFEMGGTVGLEIDFLYIQKGVRFQGSAPGIAGNVTFDATVKFDEVCVPVLLKFHVFNRAGGPDIYLAGGGEVGYILSPKIDYTASGPDVGPSPITGTVTADDLKDSLNKLDYGVIFGGGVAMPLGGVKLFVEARYHMGLANLEKVPSGGTASDTSPKTNALLILAGLKF
jgi:hypothetical protein